LLNGPDDAQSRAGEETSQLPRDAAHHYDLIDIKLVEHEKRIINVVAILASGQ
jgi:hypothetical protein